MQAAHTRSAHGVQLCDWYAPAGHGEVAHAPSTASLSGVHAETTYVTPYVVGLHAWQRHALSYGCATRNVTPGVQLNDAHERHWPGLFTPHPSQYSSTPHAPSVSSHATQRSFIE